MPISYKADQQAVIEFVVGRYEAWKTLRQGKERIWQECLHNFLCWVDPAKYENWPWRSKVCDTMSQEIADSIGAALTAQLFPIDEDYFSIKGLSSNAPAYEHVIAEEMNRRLVKATFTEAMLPIMSQCAVIGNTAFAMPWRKKSRPRRVRRGKSVQRVQEVVYDNFAFEPIDVLDLVVEPGRILQPSSMHIWRVQTNYDELKRHKELYSNLNMLEKRGKGLPSDTSRAEKQQRAAVFGLEYRPEEEYDTELLVAYGDLTIEGEFFEDALVVIGNRGELLRFEENPYFGGRPCFLGTYNSLWFTEYGRGPLEPIRGQQALIDTFTNQKVDILNLLIMGAFAFVDDGIVEPEDMVLEPGKGIPVGDINNIKPLTPPGNVAVAYQEIAQLRDRADQSSGASDYLRGNFPGGRKTAYETQQIVSGASARLNATLRHMGERTIEPALNFGLESMQQFTYGRNPELADEILEERYRLNYTGAATAILRNTKREEFQAWLTVVVQSPVLAEALNPIEINNEWRKLSNIKNERVIKTRDEIAAEQAQKMALAEAQKFLGQPASPGTPGTPGGPAEGATGAQ